VAKTPVLTVGNYELFDEIGTGGLATVHFGRFHSSAGFVRTVAIKRLHPQFAKDPYFVTMFVDEARLVTRISHPNVVPVLDIVVGDGEVFLVMEYVRGEPLSRLLRAQNQPKHTPTPVSIASAVMCNVLLGLQAAHQATTEQGEPLQLVHRDVTPQNIMVGDDGHARVFDFGVAIAAARAQVTHSGEIKGKLSYLAPEQIQQKPLDHRVDIYAASVVLWETLAGRRLFKGDNMLAVCQQVLEQKLPPLNEVAPGVPGSLEQLVRKGMSLEPNNRFSSAQAMAEALRQTAPPASALEVSTWMKRLGATSIGLRDATVKEIESLTTGSKVNIAELTDPRSRTSSGQRSAIQPPRSVLGSARVRLAIAALAVALLAIFGGLFLMRSNAADRRSGGDDVLPLPDSRPESLPATVDAAVVLTPATQPALVDAGTGAGTKPVRPPRPWTKRPPGGSKKNCDPPYNVDKDGVRIPKPECL